VIEELVDHFVKNELADEPPAVMGETGELGELSGEKLFVIEVVSEVGALEFFLEFGGLVFLKFCARPFSEGFAFFRSRLLLFFPGWHLLEENLFLNLVEEVEPGVEREGFELVESDISFPGVLVVTIVAVVVEEPGYVRSERERTRRGGRCE
jgi:hypothetical protein